MTRLYDLSLGKHDEFKRLLAQAGLTAEDIEQVLRNPNLARTMVEALREQMASPLFVSPEQQLANVRRWNTARNWGFTEANFPSVPDTLTPAGALEVPVLAVYLPDKGWGFHYVPGHVRTARELWDIASTYQHSRRLDQLYFEADQLRLLKSAVHEPGIRWVMLDLGAHWNNGQAGVRPCDVRGKGSTHAEILAAAAHFPNWIRSMNGTDVPYVWLPGYEVRLSAAERNPWKHMPFLSWNSVRSEVYLSTRRDDGRYWGYAIPVRKEL